MTLTKQTHHSVDQNLPLTPHFKPQNDELDLRELLRALWEGKLIIILITVLFSFGAVGYALTAQEWWSSKAKITLPHLQNFAAYQQQVQQFQPVFDVYQADGNILVSDYLQGLVEQEQLLKEFTLAFNSNRNKRAFLDSSPVFQAFRSNLDEATDEATGRLYNDWFSRLSSVQSNKKSEDVFDLKFQATTKSSSHQMLIGYISFVSDTVQKDLLLNLEAAITSKQNELKQKKSALILQAKQYLKVEIKRAEYALLIATAAGAYAPVQNLGDLGEREIFSINLGSKAITAKIQALKSIENLSVLDPRIQQVDSKLELLETTNLKHDIEFSTFRYLEDPQQPLARDEPKRALIAVLGTLLGGLLGVAIVLVRFSLGKEGESVGKPHEGR